MCIHTQHSSANTPPHNVSIPYLFVNDFQDVVAFSHFCWLCSECHFVIIIILLLLLFGFVLFIYRWNACVYFITFFVFRLTHIFRYCLVRHMHTIPLVWLKFPFVVPWFSSHFDNAAAAVAFFTFSFLCCFFLPDLSSHKNNKFWFCFFRSTTKATEDNIYLVFSMINAMCVGRCIN